MSGFDLLSMSYFSQISWIASLDLFSSGSPQRNYIKQFNAFLFNIRSYSREVSNIQRLKVEFSITLPWMNNFDIKRKCMEYLFYYIPPAPNKIKLGEC